MTTLAWIVLLVAVAFICFLVCWVDQLRQAAKTQAELIAAKDEVIAAIGQRLAIRDHTIELMLLAQARAEEARGFDFPTLVKAS